jgi:hypothetical protein
VVWGEIGWISGDRHSFMRGGLDAHVEGLALGGFQRAWRSAEASTHDGRLGTRHSVMRPGVGPNDMGAYSRASPLRGGGAKPLQCDCVGCLYGGGSRRALRARNGDYLGRVATPRCFRPPWARMVKVGCSSAAVGSFSGMDIFGGQHDSCGRPRWRWLSPFFV